MSARVATADKREAILDAALGLFVEKGFYGTAVPEVAAAAGVGAGTIYRYFESKEALVNALFQHWKQAMLNELLEDFPFMASPRDQFGTFVRGIATFAIRHPAAAAFMELHHHGSYLDDASRALEDQALGLVHTTMGAWKAAGIVKDLDTEILVSIVWGAMSGLQKATWQGRLQLTDEVVAAAETCMWEAIRR